jgi:lactate dehydrogenase-like 2-hydroxyacid dehydrogenase
MAIKIVVLDAALLPPGVEFPPLVTDKYGWEQYPQLTDADIAERCWRADIVVSLGTPIDLSLLKKMIKLGLLICAGDACARVDQAAVTNRGVELLAFPDADYSSTAAAEDLCKRVSAAIDHYLRACKEPGASH